MHTKTIQKIQKTYIKTYEEDVKIYKDIENSQGQGAFFLKTPVHGIWGPSGLQPAHLPRGHPGAWGNLGHRNIQSHGVEIPKAFFSPGSIPQGSAP